MCQNAALFSAASLEVCFDDFVLIHAISNAELEVCFYDFVLIFEACSFLDKLVNRAYSSGCKTLRHWCGMGGLQMAGRRLGLDEQQLCMIKAQVL